jgi:hypothetical protein
MVRFCLEAADDRRVTNDTAKGTSLTKNPGLCYVWDSYEKAEQHRVAYQVIFGYKACRRCESSSFVSERC